MIAHRGAPGVLPEHTLEVFAKAIDYGTDTVEPDLVSTKDGVLISRHDPNLDLSTDVAKRPEFASRKKTTQVDGETQTSWFASDFTLAEIKTSGATITTDGTRDKSNDGKFKVITFEEPVDFVKLRSTQLNRTIAVYPGTKNPSYHRSLGLSLEDKRIAVITAAGWNSKTSPVDAQSFEPSNSKQMKAKRRQTKSIQSVDSDDHDLKTGKLTFADTALAARATYLRETGR